MPREDVNDFAITNHEKRLDRLEKKISRLESARSGSSPVSELASRFFSVPALRAFYPMSAVENPSAQYGRAMDVSGGGRHLTRTGATVFGYDGLVPFCKYDGATTYHSYIDDPQFNITGIASGSSLYTYSVQRGLTIGCWFYPLSVPATSTCLMGKVVGPSDYSYMLLYNSTEQAGMWIDNAGDTTGVDQIYQGYVTRSGWNFVVGRWSSSYISVMLNGTINSRATTKSSIYSGTADFTIGNRGGGSYFFNGYISMAFVSAAYLSDDMVNELWLKTKSAYGI